MPCAQSHRIVAGIAVGGVIAFHESRKGAQTALPYIGGGLATLFGTLPDVLEPAHHPNHRQFFHSWAFGASLGYSGYKLYKWRPKEDWQKALRFVGLIAIASYLIHMLMDSTTPKSLPLVGKI